MKISLLVFVCLTLFFGVFAFATPPTTISHQGRLLNSDGTPAGGTFDMTYRIYEDSASGALLWEETQLVTVESGLFSVRLGETVPLDLAGFGIRPDSLWLEIKVGADPPISPRTKLAATPMSAVAYGVNGHIKTEPGLIRLDASPSLPSGLVVIDSSGDTTLSVRSHDDGSIRSFTWTQTKGPFKFDQTVNDNIGLSSMTREIEVSGDALTRAEQKVTDSGASYRIVWDSLDNLSPQFSTEVNDNKSAIMLKAAAERAFDAVISVGPKDPSFPNDSIRGTMSFRSITTDLFDTTDIFTLETGTEGAVMRMLNQSNDTAVTIDGHGGGGAGGSIVVESKSVNGLGELIKSQFRMESQAIVGESFVLSGGNSQDDQGGVIVSTDSIVLYDSTGQARMAVKKGDRISLVGFGNFGGSVDPDTTFAFDTLGNAQFAGTVRVGPIEPIATLTVAGEICATGAIGACSDARYKTDVQTISGSLDRLQQLRGVTYRWRTEEYPNHSFDDKQHIGLIAQELEQQFPELVMTDDNGFKSVDYSRVTPVLVEALKEQQDQIDRQQEQIEELTHLVRQLVDRGEAGSSEKYGMK